MTDDPWRVGVAEPGRGTGATRWSAPVVGVGVGSVVAVAASLTGKSYNAAVASLLLAGVLSGVTLVREQLVVVPAARTRLGTATAAVTAAAWVGVFMTVVDSLPVVIDRTWPLITATLALSAVLARVTLAPPDYSRLRLASHCVVLAVVTGFLLLSRTPPSHVVEMTSPLQSGEWVVVQGGRSPFLNHHYSSVRQRHAIDLAASPGREVGDDVGRAAGYGAVVVAPASGVVVAVDDSLPDDGTPRVRPQGNYIVLAAGPRWYVVLAHLKQGSAAVSVGDRVDRGQPLAEVGNSGSSSEPHLHIQVQDAADFDDVRRTFPIRFTGVAVSRRGSGDRGSVLRRNDVIDLSSDQQSGRTIAESRAWRNWQTPRL